MSKVDKKLDAAKCNRDSVKDFEKSLNVVSVVRVHDEVEVTFKRNDIFDKHGSLESEQ